MSRIDLNCDLGEGAGHDAALLPLISSANIACGAHAGDPATMRVTVELARQLGVAIGAHPGYADRKNFGRREFALPPAEVGRLVAAQVRTLQAVAAAAGAPVCHVKLHGALYNQAARDPALAAAVVAALEFAGAPPFIFVPAGSALERAARARGKSRMISEVFADRTYQADGTLTPRTRGDALITEEAAAVAQVLRLVREGRVRATDGTEVSLRADTVCLHGDGPHPVEFARRLRRELAAAGIEVGAPGP